jgi:CheY-like chemotaxis protein
MCPNIIVLDHLLDEGYGSDLCLLIKEHETTKHIPVILYSASHQIEQLAKISCADAYIPKPFDLFYFMEMVDKLAL